MSCKVEVDRNAQSPCARIYLGSGPAAYPQFTVYPTYVGDQVRKHWPNVIAIIYRPVAPQTIGTIFLDSQGWAVTEPERVTGPTATTEPDEKNFGWLLDLAMDAGLEFPALQGGSR
jgi:hypothetical protein